MALSSDDVVNWQLKTGMRGYLIPQVDELLDEVADELDRLHGRIRELEAEREAVRTSLDDQLEVEETLRRTLYQAQKAADQTVEDARTSAEQIVADGRLEADAILASAREKAQAAYDDAIREATDERASVRSALEADETRMRAVRSELRNEVERLQSIEAETRRLLHGLYEDRLNELQTPAVAIPTLEEIPEPEPVQAADDEPPAPLFAAPSARADVPGAASPDTSAVAPEDLPADAVGDASLTADEPEPANAEAAGQALTEESGEDLVVMPPAPTPRTSRRADGAPRAMGEEFPDVSEVFAPGAHDGPDAAGTDDDGAPYLGAVKDALAAIQANDEGDAVEDDLLDGSGDPSLDDDGRPKAEDLFDDSPPRRRRRSG